MSRSISCSTVVFFRRKLVKRNLHYNCRVWFVKKKVTSNRIIDWEVIVRLLVFFELLLYYRNASDAFVNVVLILLLNNWRKERKIKRMLVYLSLDDHDLHVLGFFSNRKEYNFLFKILTKKVYWNYSFPKYNS
jgi:hypothetical protein